jgi:hypothetical protein
MATNTNTTQYLSRENINAIKNICISFLADKYNIRVDDTGIEKLIINKIGEHTKDGSVPPTNINDFNKRVIGTVRDYILAEFNRKSAAAAAAAAAPVQEENKDLSEEAEFFSKLQELEIQRNAILPSTGGGTVVEPVGPIGPKSTVTGTENATAGTGAGAAKIPSIIYVPASQSTLPSKVIMINGLDRDWEYFTSRSIIQWGGDNISVGSYTQIKMSSVALPVSKFIIIDTPYLIITINGPGNNSYETVCSCSVSGVNGGGGGNSKWSTWRPVSDNLAIIAKVPPTPWTISINDIYGNLLNIGNDGATIIEHNRLINGKNSIKLSNTINVTEGDLLLLKKGGKNSIKIRALRVLEASNIIEIESIANDDLNGMVVCNVNLQVSILLEAVKNEKM